MRPPWPWPIAGAHVVATARTQGALEELDDAIYAATGRHATLVPFDLVDGGGIDRLGGAIFDRFGKLDIWVNAAATLGAAGPDAGQPHRPARLRQDREDQLHRHLPPDPLAGAPAARLRRRPRHPSDHQPRPRSQGLLGPLRRDQGGRRGPDAGLGRRDREHTVRISVLDPGRMRTQMRAQAFPGEDPMTLPAPVRARPPDRRTGARRPDAAKPGFVQGMEDGPARRRPDLGADGEASALDKGQQFGVDLIGVGRGHAVRQARLDLQRALAQQLDRSAPSPRSARSGRRRRA